MTDETDWPDVTISHGRGYAVVSGERAADLIDAAGVVSEPRHSGSYQVPLGDLPKLRACALARGWSLVEYGPIPAEYETPPSGRNTSLAARAITLARDNHQCRLRHHGVCTVWASTTYLLAGATSDDDLDYLLACCRECKELSQPEYSDPEPNPGTQW